MWQVLRSPLAAFALLIIFWFLFPTAAKYSGIWDARVNPKPGVEVRLNSGQTVRGELTREWSGDFLLTAADGKAYLFTSEGYDSMSWVTPTARERDAFWSKHWRSFVGPALLSGAIVLAMLLLIVHQSIRRART
jgi:hypothetical protein